MESYKITKRFGDYKLRGAKEAIRTSGYDEDAEYGS
jgi:hypothetical protein